MRQVVKHFLSAHGDEGAASEKREEYLKHGDVESWGRELEKPEKLGDMPVVRKQCLRRRGVRDANSLWRACRPGRIHDIGQIVWPRLSVLGDSIAWSRVNVVDLNDGYASVHGYLGCKIGSCKDDASRHILEDESDSLWRGIKVEGAECAASFEDGELGNIQERALGKEQRNDQLLLWTFARSQLVCDVLGDTFCGIVEAAVRE